MARTQAEIRANPSGYIQIKKGPLAGSYSDAIQYNNSKESVTNVIIATSPEQMRSMKADFIKEHLAKKDQICLELKNGRVLIEKKKEYSDTYEDESPTYTTYLLTRGIRTIESNHKTFRNPSYDGNPECENCGKQVVGLKAIHRSWVPDTPKVCNRCLKDIKLAIKYMKVRA